MIIVAFLKSISEFSKVELAFSEIPDFKDIYIVSPLQR
jgi:hypothetical protein